MTICLRYDVAIALLQPLRNTVNLSSMCLELKNEFDDPRFLLLNCNQHIRIHLSAVLKTSQMKVDPRSYERNYMELRKEA